MWSSVIKRRIDAISSRADVIVLKGFPVKDILKLKDEYLLIDDYIIENDKINLEKIKNVRLLQSLMEKSDGVVLMTYESFLDLTTFVRSLSALGKTFCVLLNNLLTKFENQTNEDIPDFDNSDFQNDFSQNSNYVKYYSFCMHINDKQYVQNIEYYIDDDDKILKENLFDPKPVKLKSSMADGSYVRLALENGKLDELLEDIYYNRPLVCNSFLVDQFDSEKEIFKVLQNASDSLKLGLNFYKSENKVKVEVRKDLYTVMERTWGYKSFRELNVYEDLNINTNVTKVSQGEIVETVVREAEGALKKINVGTRNVLLTSPTGAGKSLLFQLAAIYLADKYGCLTIVVSPLVALMNDQVENLIGTYKGVATLNGNIPATEKEDIIAKVKSGEVCILYLAPELLLSYSITSFIGERTIGLFVVDEAHTVTTWGRDFRVDYWFLGDYLRQSKRILNYSFPIFALTATAVWDPSGKNDMVFDIIRSLNMDPCIKFIGVVRRDDIHFEINTPNFKTNYEKNRNLLTIKRIHEAIEKKEKTIVYFPYKSTIRKIMNYDEMSDVANRVTEYHASLTPAEKNVNADGFKKGIKLVMCATKAYGMGIDVSDINTIYHHAPTGCLSDYVQEIGRVARDPNIDGVAKIDFSEKDFKFTRTLHGLSAIKPYQLVAVLKKLMALFKMKGERRNMLINSSDFEYIFPGKDVDYDQKVKSCLLLISNDLLNKLRFNAIIVRPKNLFSKAYISVSSAQREKFEQQYSNFIELVDTATNTYKVDIDDLWNKHYSHYSFPNFKRKLANGDIIKGFNITINNKVEILLNSRSVQEGRDSLEKFFVYAHEILNKMSLEHRRVSFEEIRSSLPKNYSVVDREAFLETFKMVYATDNGINGNLQSYCTIYPIQGAIQLIGQGYERLKNLYLKAYDDYILNSENTLYCTPVSHAVKVAEILNSLNIADYERLGGDKAAIFVRINNPVFINDLLRKGSYNNLILRNIYEKYEFSEWVFNYFFTTKMSDEKRWNFIEAYFLGAGKEELLRIAE